VISIVSQKAMPRQRSSTVKQRVEFGLRTIPKDKKVSVSLRVLVYVHQVLADYMQFFHQPDHHRKKEDVDRFLGHVSSGGAFEVLHTALYRKMRAMLPKEIEDAFDDGVGFEHPLPPAYHEKKG
jgi:hypothetical protein